MIAKILLWTFFAVLLAPILPMFLAVVAGIVGFCALVYGAMYAYHWLDRRYESFQGYVTGVVFTIWLLVVVGGSLWVVVISALLVVEILVALWGMIRG
ncbi:hypothetical protein RBB50_000303 [Rhinocladiella similis]